MDRWLPALRHEAIAEPVQRSAGVPSSLKLKTVFLNFPYDRQFEPLFLAYVAGVCSYGLVPRAALEIPGGERRLDRIVDLIESCRYSFHDLSRVELDLHRPRTPRMNMPFELGLTVMASYHNPKRHTWCVFEKSYRRTQKSLSDLAGTDVYSTMGARKEFSGKSGMRSCGKVGQTLRSTRFWPCIQICRKRDPEFFKRWEAGPVTRQEYSRSSSMLLRTVLRGASRAEGK